MPQMGVAHGAQHLGAHHAMAMIGQRLQRLRIDRAPKTGPAAAGIVLVRRIEQRLAATSAAINARPLRCRARPAERRLRAVLTRHPINLGRQFPTPLLRRFLDSSAHTRNPPHHHASPRPVDFTRTGPSASFVRRRDTGGQPPVIYFASDVLACPAFCLATVQYARSSIALTAAGPTASRLRSPASRPPSQHT